MNEENQEKKSKKKVITLIAAIVLILIAALVVFWFNSQIRATTMRILRMEGIVSLEDNGKKKTATDNLRLKSGNALSTEVKSLVSIGLDDTKIVTLDEKSRAEFNQKGRKLDLKLTDGSLFFEVQKPLAADETMDIRTSTMVVGIRGTSGWVSVDGEHEQLIVTDGKVHVIGTNPVTGEVKEIDVKAGQRITVYLYNDRTVDSIEFVLEEVTERELPEFLLNRLRENPALLDKVCKETGWDKPWILGQVRDEMPVVKLDDDVPPDDGPDNDGGDPSLEVTDAEDELETPESDIDPEHPNGARWSERRAARAQIVFTDVNTGIVALKDGTLFDPVFYATSNPDVVKDYGTDTDALLAHWLKRGKKEGRPPIAPPTPTPTPIPWWMYPQESAVEPEEEDDDEPSPTPVAFSFPPNGVVSYTPIAGGGYAYNVSIEDSSGNSLGSANLLLDPNGFATKLIPQSAGSYSIPMDITGGGNTLTVSNLNDIQWDGSSRGNSSDPLTIYNKSTGNYVQVTPDGGGGNDYFTLYDSSGNIIQQVQGDYYFGQFMLNAGTMY